jgi:hypothetical protein
MFDAIKYDVESLQTTRTSIRNNHDGTRGRYLWYNWIYYNDSNVQFPDQKVVLGRYLGPTESEVDSVITGNILASTGEVIRCNTFRHLTAAEIASSDNHKERDKFDETVGNRCGVPFKQPELGPSFGVSVTTPDYEVYDNDETEPIVLPEIDDIVGTAGYNPEDYNGYYVGGHPTKRRRVQDWQGCLEES